MKLAAIDHSFRSPGCVTHDCTPATLAGQDRRVKTGTLLTVAVGIGLLLTLPAWFQLLKIGWTNPDASHLLLAPLGAAVAVWFRRGALQAPPGTNGLSLGIAVAATILGLIGSWIDLRLAWHLGAVLLVIAAALAPLSPRPARALIFPLAILLFGVPIPGTLDRLVVQPLTSLQLNVIDSISHLVGLGWVVTGEAITMAERDVALERGCAGFRILWPILIIGCTAAAISRRSWQRRLMVIGLAPIVALVLNLLRLFPTLLCHHHRAPVLAEQVHDGLGLLLLSLAAVVPLIWLNSRSDHQPSVPWKRFAAGSSSPIATTSRGLLALPLLVAVAWIFWHPWINPPDLTRGRSLAAQLEPAVPISLGEWIGADRELPREQARRLQADATVYREFTHWSTGESVQLLVSFHVDGRTHQGHTASQCYPVLGWQCLGVSPKVWMTADRIHSGKEFQFERTVPEHAGLVVHELILSPVRNPAPGTSRITDRFQRKPTNLARIQILFPREMTPRRREEVTGLFLDALSGWFEEVTANPEKSPVPDSVTTTDADVAPAMPPCQIPVSS